MTEPPRLLHSTANPRVRALLEAGLPDAPRPGTALRTAVSLGLSASALSTVTAGTASAAVGTASAFVPLGSSGSLLMVAKWLAVGVVGGIGLAGGASWVASSTPSNTTTLPVRSGSSTSSVRVGSRTERAGSASSNEVSQQMEAAQNDGRHSLAPAEPRSAPARMPSAPSAITKSIDGRLAREVGLIDEARRALAGGNAERALGTLDAYAALERTGTLDRESQVLRIDALLSRGEQKAALTLARAYLQAYPKDPHATKLQAILNQSRGMH